LAAELLVVGTPSELDEAAAFERAAVGRAPVSEILAVVIEVEGMPMRRRVEARLELLFA
jgi:hypothetical protein